MSSVLRSSDLGSGGGGSRPDAIAALAHPARAAQADWAKTPVPHRLKVFRRFRHRLAERSQELVATVGAARPGRRASETLAAEILPLAAACRFLEQEAEILLAPRFEGSSGPSFWLGRVELEVRREPRGLVLLLAPANYPLFLPAVQALQALAAGNAVFWKPGVGGEQVAQLAVEMLAEAGLDPRLAVTLPEDLATARAALALPPDLTVVTGSLATGRAVLDQLAQVAQNDRGQPSPVILELSGEDPAIVLPSADLDRAARAIVFGRTINAGETCIAPRRILVARALALDLKRRLSALGLPLADDQILAFDSEQEALALAAATPYALGASIFGRDDEALALADRLRAGVVVINDVVSPTADPRLPFGGRGASGFGSTRGREGLLEMTVPKAIATRRGVWLPHLRAPTEGDSALLAALLALTHGPWRGRPKAWISMIRAMKHRRRE